MKIEIDEQKILTEIIERDESLHIKIKDKVQERLINKITREIESKYIKSTYRGDEIATEVLDELKEQQTKLVVEILKEFYDSYRYKKADVAILKELKTFIGERQD